jgi:hypothetical protein
MRGSMCSRIEQLEREVARQVQLHFETLRLKALKLVPTILSHLDISVEHQCICVPAI